MHEKRHTLDEIVFRGGFLGEASFWRTLHEPLRYELSI